MLAIPTVDAQVINYSVEPRSGANFNRIEQLSIIIFADKLSKEYRSPYTLTYSIVDKEIFPKKINIRAKQGKKITKINFTLKSVEFNKPINTSFSIPENYKHINL